MAQKLTFHRPAFVLLISLLSVAVCFSGTVEGVIGMNWGRQTSHRMIPSMVVDILLQNGIHHLKVFSPSVNIMKAFAGSDLVVTLTMPNLVVDVITIPGFAKFWLNEHVRAFKNLGVDVRYLIIGTEPPTGQTASYYNSTLEAFKYTEEAIRINNHDYLTATLQHSTFVLDHNITKPSEADFKPDVKEKIKEFLTIIKGTKTPFVVNILPFQAVNEFNMNMEFAFMDSDSRFWIEDNGNVYTNVFEFIFDSFVVALGKAGAPPDIEIMVGAIGWPTDGCPGANLSNAERFYKGFLPYIKSNKGTPLRPGISIDVYIHSLADETLQARDGGFLRHFGIYKFGGEPKFKIDLTGQGRDIYPTTAKGTVSMPKRWCIFNGDMTNLPKVQAQFDFACQKADCTSLFPGGSCSNLTYEQNVSYAFNNYFQMMAQYGGEGASCGFGRLGMVVPDDPSIGTCEFPVEILAAETADAVGMAVSGSCRVWPGLYWVGGLVMVLSCFWTLLAAGMN